MQLLNQQYPGFVFWGTKKGKAVFLSHNLTLSNNELDERIMDVRNQNFLINNGNEFYCMDQKSGYRLFSLIHIMNDDFDREGYLAVSMVLPSAHQFKNGAFWQVLDALKKAYISKYVITRYPSENYMQDIREDASVFLHLFQDSKLAMEPAGSLQRLQGAPKGTVFVSYNGLPQLDEFFSTYFRKELHAYERVYILPNDIRLNQYPIEYLKLEPYKRHIGFRIKILDRNTNSPIQQAQLALTLLNTGGYPMPQNVTVNGEHQVDMPKSQKFSIEVTKEGYQPFRAEYEVTEHLNPLINCYLEPKPAPIQPTTNGGGSTSGNTRAATDSGKRTNQHTTNQRNQPQDIKSRLSVSPLAAYIIVAFIAIGVGVFCWYRFGSGSEASPIIEGPHPPDTTTAGPNAGGTTGKPDTLQILGYQDGVFTIDAKTLIDRIKAFKDNKTYNDLGGVNTIIQGKEREAWTLITKGLILFDKSSFATFLRNNKTFIDTAAVNKWATTNIKQKEAQQILGKIFSSPVTTGNGGGNTSSGGNGGGSGSGNSGGSGSTGSKNGGSTGSGTSTGSGGSGPGKTTGGSTATETLDN